MIAESEYERQLQYLRRLKVHRTYIYPRLIVSTVSLIAKRGKRQRDKEERYWHENEP